MKMFLVMKEILPHVNMRTNSVRFFFVFFYCYLPVPRPTLGHSRGDSLSNAMLVTMLEQFLPKGNKEPRNEAGSVSQAKHLVEFEPGTF